jgi:hypothetical protein
MAFDQTNKNSGQRTTQGGGAGIGEAFGFVAIAVVAMGLLAVGYNIRPTTADVQATQQNQQSAQPSTAMGATPQTQPRAAGNNTPAAPTGSTTGQGANNGSTGTPTTAGANQKPAGDVDPPKQQ